MGGWEEWGANCEVIVIIYRLKYIMLLKLPIIFSGNSFYFNQLFPVLGGIMHSTISLIYIAMVKLQYILLINCLRKLNAGPLDMFLINEAQKRFLVLSTIAKSIFSELRCYGYE